MWTYDTDSEVATRTRPAPNQGGGATVTTSYSWDALHRLLSKSYSDGTPGVAFAYDQSNVWGWALSNTIGRRIYESSGTVGQANGAGQFFSYGSMVSDF